MESGLEDEAKKAIDAAKLNIDLPEGISFSELRMRYGKEDFFAAGLALVLSVLFIYMLMAFLFERFGILTQKDNWR